MFDEIMNTVSKKSKEEISISVGEAVLITVGAFILGLVMGILFGSTSAKKKAKRRSGRCSEGCCDESTEDFDAEQYVRDLKFDNE